MVHFYGFHVAKYTSPMDAMGNVDAVIEKYMAQVSYILVLVLTLY